MAIKLGGNPSGQNPAQQLLALGTSVWYDNISRDIIENGELKRLVAECGVRGLTSNPTIFDKAVGSSQIYDSQIAELKGKQLTADQVFEELAIVDIAHAADLLLPIFTSSNGDDGYVSIEVSPLLSSDTKGTVEEARRLYSKLNRPNIMVKVPGTKEGIPAVQELLEAGINVNITLLFSVENYSEVALTYCRALKNRLKQGKPVDSIRSVASFFVSRVDSAVDALLDQMSTQEASSNPARAEQAQQLRGRFGIANSKIAYKRFQEIFNGPEFAELRSAGAKPQRPLWASTGTKDPKYRDVIYIEELVGPETVNTMPHATLMQFIDHGIAKETLTKDVPAALDCHTQLLALGIPLAKVLQDLQIDGVKKFVDSFKALNTTISKKLS